MFGVIIIMPDNDLTLRLIPFFSIMLIMLFWEYISPKRKLGISRKFRWIRNISFIIVSNLVLRLFVPFTAIGVGLYVENHNLGLFNQFEIPLYAEIIITIIALDLVIYLQHRLFHTVPILWRLHKVHHIDQEIDVSTALLFHPLEIVISACIKAAAILALGVPVLAIIAFEIILNAMAMFNHGNIAMCKYTDKILRTIFVTPDMHRVHHSTIIQETNSNFGFNLSFWDKIFGTYIAQPSKGHIEMQIGLEEYPDYKKSGFITLMKEPFRRARK